MNKARGYQSLTPANNMILKRKWDQTRFDMHRMKVRNARPMIDNKPPETYMHLHLNLKKMQMEEERLATVQRDNRILLEKMSHIMTTKSRTDNVNGYHHRSLNTTQRQRDMLRVTHENQAILKRIQSKEPHYNHMQWLDQWQVNKGYMANISKYNHTWMHTEKLKRGHLTKSSKKRRFSVLPSANPPLSSSDPSQKVTQLDVINESDSTSERQQSAD